MGSTMVYDKLLSKLLENLCKKKLKFHHIDLSNESFKDFIPDMIKRIADQIEFAQLYKKVILFAYGDAGIIAVKLQEYLIKNQIILKKHIEIFAINSFLEIKEDDFEPIELTIGNILKSATKLLDGKEMINYKINFIDGIKPLYPDIDKCQEYFKKLKVDDFSLDYVRKRFATFTFPYIKGLMEIKNLEIPDNLSLAVDKDVFKRKLAFGITMGTESVDDFFFKKDKKKGKLFYYNKQVSVDIFDDDFYQFLYKSIFWIYT